MAVQTTTKPEGPTGDFKGDIQVDDTPPDKKMLEKANGLMILDEDKRKHTFQSLYSGKDRILVVFIRHFFCGNCQEYTRRLSTELPPATLSALPKPTSLILIGCGSPDLIPMYKRETGTLFPVYADPTRKLYDVLGMTRTLSLGNKDPKYMRQSVYRVGLQSIVQGLKTGRNMLSAGDFWQVGGEFLFESDGAVSWCHRMKNTRDHSELDQLEATLQMRDESDTTPAVAPGKPVGSRRSISGGLARKLSDRRKSWRNSMSRSRSRNTQANGSVPREAMERLKEEDDAPSGDRDAALAKLTGTPNATNDAAATSKAGVETSAQEPAVNGTATEGLMNGTAKPTSQGNAAEGHVSPAPETALGKDSISEPASDASAIVSDAEGAKSTPNANGILHNSTPFVQSLMNGSINKEPSKPYKSADGNLEKVAAKELDVDATKNTNGHLVEA